MKKTAVMCAVLLACVLPVAGDDLSTGAAGSVPVAVAPPPPPPLVTPPGLVPPPALKPTRLTEGDYTCTVADGRATITKYTGSGGDVTVPATLGGVPVRCISSGAFGDCRTLTSVTISDGIVELQATFYGCDQLAIVTIPKSLTRLDSYAFCDGRGLTSIRVDAENPAFCSDSDGVVFTKDMKKLVRYPTGRTGSYTVPDGVTTVGGRAFLGSRGLTGVVIPPSVGILEYDAFSQCNNLAKVLLTNGLTEIHSRVFWRCSSLTDIEIPDTVTHVRGGAFTECAALTSVTISAGVTSIGGNLIESCENLQAIRVDPANAFFSAGEDGVLLNKPGTELIAYPGGSEGNYAIPAGVTTIRPGAFGFCRKLTGVTIPNSVTIIGDRAFCTSGLTHLNIPASVTHLGRHLVGAFENFAGFSVAPDNAAYSSTPDGVLFNKDKTVLVRCSIHRLSSYRIPDGVTCIGEAAFSTPSLESVIVPASVTRIGKSVLSYCKTLAAVYFHGDAPAIDAKYAYEYPFYSSEKVTIHYRAGTKGWDKEFCGRPTALWDGTEPSDKQPVSTVTVAPKRDGQTGDAPTGPASVVPAATPTTLPPPPPPPKQDNSVVAPPPPPPPAAISPLSSAAAPADQAANDFTYTIKDGKTTITGFREDYSGALSIPGTLGGCPLTTIGEKAFHECTGLTEVNIPSGVTSIQRDAFADCSNLTHVAFPDGITSIGPFAFYHCRRLSGVTIPASVTSISSNAFRECTGLTSVTIPEGVTSIGKSAFLGCSGLTDVTIPDSVETIEAYAFTDCTSLTRVKLPDGVTSIGANAFAGCTSLAEITIPDSVISIGTDAFRGCSSLPESIRSRAPATPEPSPRRSPVRRSRRTSMTAGYGTYLIQDNTATLVRVNEDYSGVLTVPGTLELSPVTAIDDTALPGCTKLTGISIPASVTSIAPAAFWGCSALSRIEIDPANPAYACVDGILYTKDMTTLVRCPPGKAGSVTVPDSVTVVENGAFADCRALTGVALPSGLTCIAPASFVNCTGLTAMALPSHVTSIGPSAFRGCTSLAAIDVPIGTVWIGSSAFAGCTALTRAKIPDSVIRIGTDAFRACTGLPESVLSLAASRSAPDSADSTVPPSTDVSAPPPAPSVPSSQAEGVRRALEARRRLLENRARTNASNDPAIHRAAAHGDAAEITRLLQDDPEQVDARNEAGETPLMVVAKRNRADVIRLLIRAGADLEASCSKGWTALRHVVTDGSSGRPGVPPPPPPPLGVKKVTSSSRGRSPRDATAELLIAWGARVDGVDDQGRTLLQMAVLDGEQELVEILKQGGARADDLWTAAAVGGVGEVSEFLAARGPDVNARDDRGWRPLHYWAKYGSGIEVAELLLANGADVNALTFEDETPLELALAGEGAGATGTDGKAAAAEWLRQHGGKVLPPLVKAPVARRGGTLPGMVATALHDAVRDGDLAAAGRSLMTDPGQLDARDAEGTTPLHSAVSRGLIELVKLLLEKGADPNVSNTSRSTPLHSAAYGKAEIAGLLLTNGARTDVTDNEGLTPLHYAALFGGNELVDILASHGARPVDLVTATALGDVEKVKEFLAGGASINKMFFGRITPLDVAAMLGQVPAAKLLLDAGARPNAHANPANGRRPLERAAEHGQAAMVDLLLARGADVSSGVGENALVCAALSGSLEVTRRLLAAGAGVNSRAPSAGDRPLWYATQCQAEDVVEALVTAGANVNAVFPSNSRNLRRIPHRTPMRPPGMPSGKYSPLHAAAWLGNLDIGGRLLAKGATPDILTAVGLGDLDAVKAYLADGNDINAPVAPGNRPVLCWARTKTVAEFLLQQGASVKAAKFWRPTPLHYAFACGREVADLFLANGADVNAQDTEGRTPLHDAVSYGTADLVTLLLDNGAEVNALTFDDETPMELTLKEMRKGRKSTPGKWSIAELLSERGGKVLPPLVPLPSLPGDLDRPPPMPPVPGSRTPTPVPGIHSAASKGDVTEGERLLAENAGLLNAKDKSGATPLLLAARRGQVEFVEMLLDKGADPNESDTGLSTPLHRVGPSVEIADLLTAHGARVDAVDKLGRTPLSHAVAREGPEITRFLQAKGTVAMDLLTAAALGDVEKAKEFLAQGSPVNGQDYRGNTALHLAAAFGQVQVAELLLAAGARPNVHHRAPYTNVRYRAPLLRAIERGHVGMVKLLLDADVDPNPTYYKGNALQYAIQAGSPEMVERLVQAGVDVNRMSGYRQNTPLINAVSQRSPELVRCLLAHGADVNGSSGRGRTPLGTAIGERAEDLVDILLAAGADVNAPQPAVEEANTGLAAGEYSPLHAAAWVGHRGIGRRLLDRGAKPDMLAAVGLGDLEAIKAYLAQGNDANSPADPGGLTLLCWARDKKTAEYLIEQGASVHAAEPGKSTPLHFAYVSGPAMAEYLIDHGADVNAKGPKGTTPLHGAARHGNADIAELLIEKGADVTAKTTNSARLTPLWLAERYKQADVADLLRQHGARAPDRRLALPRRPSLHPPPPALGVPGVPPTTEAGDGTQQKKSTSLPVPPPPGLPAPPPPTPGTTVDPGGPAAAMSREQRIQHARELRRRILERRREDQ